VGSCKKVAIMRYDERVQHNGKQMSGMAVKGRQMSRFRSGGMVLLTALLAACSSAPVRTPEVPSLAGLPAIEVPDVNILQTSPELREFATSHVGPRRGQDRRAWSLAYAALDPYLLNFKYDPRVTLPADEGFMLGRGNCLTFSSIFVAMAREAGLTAWYQEVKIPPVWSTVNETMLFSMHVNAVVQDRSSEFTVDVSRRKQLAVEQVRRLSDEEALAQYYNNLGADALVEDNRALAYAYFRKALSVDASLHYLWSNLGVVLRRNEQTEEAVLAYQTALKLEPQQSVALNNLYTIYDEDGDFEKATAIQARVERNRLKNPYYLNYLAEVAVEEQRFDDAIGLLNKALRIESNEYRFYFTLAQSQFLSGKTGLAQESLEQARQLAPPGLEPSELSLPGDNL
jgi:Flp pilus assembly protein TadD